MVFLVCVLQHAMAILYFYQQQAINMMGCGITEKEVIVIIGLHLWQKTLEKHGE